MDYSKIVSVTGLPGLYELINTKSDGAIIRSLEDKTTKFASSRIHNFSHLESIEVYTIRENVNLVEVFQAMKKANDSLPDAKDNAAIKKYFERVYPDIDFDRVYNSDLKKMVKWFDILSSNDIEMKISQPEPEPEKAEEPEEKPVKPVERKDSKQDQEETEKKKPKKNKEEKKKKAEKEPASSIAKTPAKKAAKKKGK